MYPLFKRSTIRSKHLFAFSAALLSLVLIAAIAIMSGAASASPELPVGNGSYVPLAPPTVPPTVGSHTPTPGPGTPSATSVPATSTAVTSPTVPGPQPSAEPTWASCPMNFTDVLPGAWFYEYIHWLYCRGVVQGYPDGTFRPGNQATRGQIVKIVSGAFHCQRILRMDRTSPTFQPTRPSTRTSKPPTTLVSSPATLAVVLASHVILKFRPYSRPDFNVTRGQLSKVIVLTAQLYDPVGWIL